MTTLRTQDAPSDILIEMLIGRSVSPYGTLVLAWTQSHGRWERYASRHRAGVLAVNPWKDADVTTMYVTYPGDASTRFDQKYYVDGHLPLVMQAWGPHGLESVAAFFPPGDGAGTIAVCICRFRDEAALRAAIASPQSGPVMADVAKFTGAAPTQSLAAPL